MILYADLPDGIERERFGGINIVYLIRLFAGQIEDRVSIIRIINRLVAPSDKSSVSPGETAAVGQIYAAVVYEV